MKKYRSLSGSAGHKLNNLFTNLRLHHCYFKSNNPTHSQIPNISLSSYNPINHSYNNAKDMYGIGVYADVRNRYKKCGNISQICRDMIMDWRTVKGMTINAEPPGYRLTKPKPKPVLDKYIPHIEKMFEEDTTAPPKQRHTARRVFQRLRDEHGYSGSESSITKIVSTLRAKYKEHYIPLEHIAGTAQFDFGECKLIIDGEEKTGHYMSMVLCKSGKKFVKSYPKENTVAFVDAHIEAFRFFGGVPQEILYDNTKIAVSKIYKLEGGRKLTESFLTLQSYYRFDSNFAASGKGNEKGIVENSIGTSRRNFMVPVPIASSFDELNANFLRLCQNYDNHVQAGKKGKSVGELFNELDKPALQSLPEIHHVARDVVSCKVNKVSLVTYDNNKYSVPIQYAYQSVIVKAYINSIVISSGASIIARHKRSWDRDDTITQFSHYYILIRRKINSLDQALPIHQLDLPAVFLRLRHLLELHYGKDGKRSYVDILILLNSYTKEQLSKAIDKAIKEGIIDVSYIKKLLLNNLEIVQKSIKLNTPLSNVHEANLTQYNQLIKRSA